MQENKKFKLVSSKKTRYLLPNILTLAGVCLGISSIKFSIDGNFYLAVMLILFASILDALDGRIARLIKGTSDFGKELDSLTDVISFGVAPAFIMYFWSLNNLGRVGWLVCLIYVICVALRLARFNITSNTNAKWKDNFFEGVPSPAGGILVLFPLIYSFSEFQLFSIENKYLVPGFFILTSILLISKIPTYSFKKIVVPRRLTIFLLFTLILFFGLLLIYTYNVIVISTLIYLLLIPISFFHFRSLSKKFIHVSQDGEDQEDVL